MKIVIVVIVLIALILTINGCRTLVVKSYKGPRGDHFNGRKFYQPGGNKMGDFRELMAYQLTNRRAKWHKYVPKQTVSDPPPHSLSEGIGYKHINHSTVLIQLNGVNILTDPIYVKRASPFQIVGPSRYRSPSIPYEELPPIDVVLISHDHYDHLDVKTLKRLSDDHHPTILVGLGLKAFLEKFDIANVIEMDWHDQQSVRGVDFTFLTAIHWSNRGMSPYKTLWGSYMIEGPLSTVYFAGDTGYGDHFKEIANKYPSIDLALIPIGAYVPRSFMQYVHMPPEDAFKAHLDLNPAKSFGIHWGTFQLTGEGMYDPIDELQVILDQHGVDNFHYDRYHDQYYHLNSNK